MAYVDGVVLAVPAVSKQAYLDHATLTAGLFKEVGALSVVEAWGDDVLEGKVTDLRKAVQAVEGEVVVFSWITWPDKATRDAGWGRLMQDERLASHTPPFDGKRMIFGGFDVILEV